jgi:hypothetical protein
VGSLERRIRALEGSGRARCPECEVGPVQWRIGWGPNSGMLEALGLEYEPPQVCPKCGKLEEVITIGWGPTMKRADG